MYPHRIRLRGPWEYETLTSATGELRLSGRLNMPCRLHETVQAGVAGRVRFRRRFGLPRILDEHERVWLTFRGVPTRAAITLNTRQLEFGAGDECECEVTALLGNRNELLIELDLGCESRDLWGEAALEIRTTSYLRRVQFRAMNSEGAAQLEATGEVVGPGAETLELYLIRDRSNVAYTTVTASPTGRPFHLVSEKLQEVRGSDQAVRLELVAGAVVYYASNNR
jgi:hypothetical protein